MTDDADMHWSDLVGQARELDAGAFPFDAPVSEDDHYAATLAACETFYGHGFPDDQLGSVDDFGHYFRVSRWTVATATDGRSELTEHGSTSEAVAWWATLEAEYNDFCVDVD